MAQLRDVDLRRDAVLEAHRDRDHQRVHQALERRPVLRDVNEDVAGRAVLVQADVDVALVVADLELAADLGAIQREAPALRLACHQRAAGEIPTNGVASALSDFPDSGCATLQLSR